MRNIEAIMMEIEAVQMAYALGYASASDLSEMLNRAATALVQVNTELEITTFDLIESYETSVMENML